MQTNNMKFCKNKLQQTGFTLIELMVAMVISLTLIFACTTLYSSLKSSIAIAQNLANAQESFRGAYYVMSRSVRQADSIEVSESGAKLTVNLSSPSEGDMYSCLGNTVPSAGGTDTYALATGGLSCDDGTGSELIALDIDELKVAESGAADTAGRNGVIVTLKIDAVSGALGSDGLTFNLALRQKVLTGL